MDGGGGKLGVGNDKHSTVFESSRNTISKRDWHDISGVGSVYSHSRLEKLAIF